MEIWKTKFDDFPKNDSICIGGMFSNYLYFPLRSVAIAIKTYISTQVQAFHAMLALVGEGRIMQALDIILKHSVCCTHFLLANRWCAAR